MQTLAGVVLALLAVAFVKAAIEGRGREWTRSKLLGG